MGGREQENLGAKPTRAIKARPCLKNTQHKKGLAEWLKMVECLPCKSEALSTNPMPQHKKEMKNPK
jgi:hypothetical protein